MKIKLIITISLLNLAVFAQDIHNKNPDTIRKQGYLIIETNIDNELNDIPIEYVFIPFDKMKPDLYVSYYENIKPASNEVYLTIPLISDTHSISSLNTLIKKFIAPNYSFEVKQIKMKDFFKSAKTLYKYRNVKDKAFKVVYVDGLWVKMKVKKKNSLLITEAYNVKMLNPNIKENYDFYFLIDIFFLGYDLLLNDKSLERR